MTFKQRLPFYLFGLTIGLVIVIFFLGKKDTQFDYGPNARVLKNIRLKKHLYTPEVIEAMQAENIDSTAIEQLLKTGDVDLWNKFRSDSCTSYQIEGSGTLAKIQLTVRNCDSVAVFEKLRTD
ncbi:MAG: hypothetical protein QGH06_01265 [Lutibacter sp.]|jgi:hypothetical protein|nr:hypothetical protein [Lutibacter sp.]